MPTFTPTFTHDSDPTPGLELMQSAAADGKHWVFIYTPGSLAEHAFMRLGKYFVGQPFQLVFFGEAVAPCCFAAALLPRDRLSPQQLIETCGGNVPPSGCSLLTVGNMPPQLAKWLCDNLYVPKVPVWN